jgi:hypothetical protein
MAGTAYEIFIKPSGLLSSQFAIVPPAVALIALAAICFLASLFFLYVLLQWMRDAKRTTNALKKVAPRRIVLPTARRTEHKGGKNERCG